MIKPDGSRLTLENITGFTINREIGAADDPTIKIAQSNITKTNALHIELKIDGRVEFSGVIDEINITESSGGYSTVIYARSTAALLLDNEAKPCDYKNADSKLIEQNHIAPFGLECVCQDDGEYTDLSVYKGISHWQVIKSFCRRCYGTEPYVNEEGKVVLCKRNDTDAPLYFSNSDGIAYSSVTVNNRYYKLISSVFTKASGREEYDIENTNELAQCFGVVRRRYVDGEEQGNDAARQLIDSGNEQSLGVRLSSPCFVHCPLNSLCTLKMLSGQYFDSLRCIKVKISLTHRGFESVITMSGEIRRRE